MPSLLTLTDGEIEKGIEEREMEGKREREQEKNENRGEQRCERNVSF